MAYRFYRVEINGKHYVVWGKSGVASVNAVRDRDPPALVSIASKEDIKNAMSGSIEYIDTSANNVA